MEIDATHRNDATTGLLDAIPENAADRAPERSPDSGRTPPDAFVLRCGRVDGGAGILALDGNGDPIVFKLGEDEDDALARVRDALGARRAFCEPSLSGKGFPPSLVPRPAVISRAALLALVRVRKVVPPTATVGHMRAVLDAFACAWSAEPWTAGIELADVEISGAVSGRWRIAPMWREGKLLGIAWIQHDGPIQRRQQRTFVVGGELQRMAVLFSPEGYCATAIEQAFGFRRVPVPMRRDGPAPAEEWIAMAASMQAYAGLRARPRATASARAAGSECHATARALSDGLERRQA